ncbi:unnamed protein product, partial [Rotaria sp. Silwood1]
MHWVKGHADNAYNNRCDVLATAAADSGLPGISGKEGITYIRQFWNDVYVVVITGNDDEAVIYDCIERGANGYMLKPFRLDDLLGHIEIIRNGGTLLSPQVAAKLFKQIRKQSSAIEIGDYGLTTREKQVVEELLKGMTYKEIGNVLAISSTTGFSVDSGECGVVATLTDITAKKMQEAQLLELIKKEKELNELKSAFVNMVSHELRTPLTVISSSAEILELMLKSGKGYNDVSIYTQQIIDEVEKMTAFMQDLLMISKIESGKININPTTENIVAFVKSVISRGFAPYKDG